MPPIIICLLLLNMLISRLVAGGDRELFEAASHTLHNAHEVAMRDPDQAKQLYRQAVCKYQYLARRYPSSVPVLMNLANACFFAGDLGHAILYYHRALRLQPANEDLRHNLEYVRSQTIDSFPDPPVYKLVSHLFFWHRLSLWGRLWLFAAFYLLTWVLLFLRFFFNKWYFRNVAIGGAIVACLLLASIMFSLLPYGHRVDGVITAKEVMAYQGDGYIYEPAFTTPLHAGTEFRLLARRRNWYYVQLNDGSRCWIPGEKAEMIVAPTPH